MALDALQASQFLRSVATSDQGHPGSLYLLQDIFRRSSPQVRLGVPIVLVNVSPDGLLQFLNRVKYAPPYALIC